MKRTTNVEKPHGHIETRGGTDLKHTQKPFGGDRQNLENIRQLDASIRTCKRNTSGPHIYTVTKPYNKTF
jgi:hypothetical protein